MAEPNADYHDDQKDRQVQHGSSSSDNEELGGVDINENALLRKIDFRLLPAVGILYLLSFLDRSNVANAKIEGLADDLGMSESGHQTEFLLPGKKQSSSLTNPLVSRQPISDRPDTVLYRLCPLRSWLAHLLFARGSCIIPERALD